MNTPDISWFNLALGMLLFLIPLVVLFYYKTGLAASALVSIMRMVVQLLFVGLYLRFIFDHALIWLNLLWVIAMILIAALTIVKRSDLNRKYFLLPVTIGILAGMIVTESMFLGPVLGLENPFNARFFIPISGMILGNCLQASIIGMRSFYSRLKRDEDDYKYMIACGASRDEALYPFIQEAIKNAFNPAIATMAVMGLISLPGMMTGQILGGTEPLVAIKYQIMIMASIFTGTVITVVVGIFISKRFVFDDYDMIRRDF